MEIKSVITYMLSNWEMVVTLVLVADKIVAITPTKKDDLILHYIKKFIGVFKK